MEDQKWLCAPCVAAINSPAGYVSGDSCITGMKERANDLVEVRRLDLVNLRGPNDTRILLYASTLVEGTAMCEDCAGVALTHRNPLAPLGGAWRPPWGR